MLQFKIITSYNFLLLMTKQWGALPCSMTVFYQGPHSSHYPGGPIKSSLMVLKLKVATTGGMRLTKIPLMFQKWVFVLIGH